MTALPTIEDIRKARHLIGDYINLTPVLSSSQLNEMAGCELYFKCENFQKVGAFKYRGATNAVLNLSKEEAGRGVATHSSGNHAQALALAAARNGIKSHIVMPDNSPIVKKNAVAGYGAEITYCEPTLQARESALAEIVAKTGATFIHPYDNFNVICGQGTAALELCAKVLGLDFVIAPVGGGGLLSGTSIAVKSLQPATKVIAAEPEGADDAMRSFRSGVIQPSLKPNTIADGLLTSLSELTFSIIRKNVDDIITVSDVEIIRAMKLIWERMKIIVEPSSATVLALILSGKVDVKNSRMGLIISGGNVDLDKLPWTGGNRGK